MSKCCRKPEGSPLETLPAGLDRLPRQLRGFPEVRSDLLAALVDHPALASWRPSGNDFALMWLEMWAYIADVLGFYEERVANESYLRTAVRRPALRRIVELLGHTPSSGVAGSASLAALAEGEVAVSVPAATGFRSSGFDLVCIPMLGDQRLAVHDRPIKARPHIAPEPPGMHLRPL